MAHPAQRPGKRHVDPVIITGRQIQGRKGAVHEWLRVARITAEQIDQAVIDAFRLEQSTRLDPSGLRDAAVDRADRRRLIARDRTGVRAQRAREERIERRVRRGVGFSGLGHIGAVGADKPAYDGILESGPQARQAQGQAGDRMLWQAGEQQDTESIQERWRWA
jgi:hypothetical protein